MRRIGRLLSTATFLWVCSDLAGVPTSGRAMPPEPDCGDIDCDGRVDAIDALALLRRSVGLPSPARSCPCDVTTTTTTLDECANPLDEDLLSQLTFGLNGLFEMVPGSSRTFELGLFECCYYVEPIDVCATFSVVPEGAGASIDARTGRVEIGCGVADGSSFTVVADVENGRHTETASIYVYEPSRNPLRGYHSEVSQLRCDSDEERAPAVPILELVFYSYGWFEVTWSPFELYVDYWGTYVFDLETGALSMTVTGGNYVPWDFDGNGHATFEGNQIVLHDIWLGSPAYGYGTRGCGHRFR